MNVSLQNRLSHFSGLLVVAVALTAVLTAAVLRVGLSLPVSATVASATEIQPGPLTQRVLPASALHGFVVTERPSVTRSAQTWAVRVERSATPTREAARLDRLGFVAGVREELHGRYPLAAEAVSDVERYRTPAGARAELDYQRAMAEAGWATEQATPLRAIAIPGAVGWIVRGPRIAAVNIMFSVGREFYLVGSAAAPGITGAPTAHQMIAAAQLENLIANGCVAKPAPAAHHASQQDHRMVHQSMLLH